LHPGLVDCVVSFLLVEEPEQFVDNLDHPPRIDPEDYFPLKIGYAQDQTVNLQIIDYFV
jgi:hypothetical protein